jgi:hypothetical protein
LATLANELIYRRHLLSSSDNCQAIFSAQKGACLPLSGTSPAVSAGGCPVQNWFRDVLVSLGGCGSWLPLSRNFSVASLLWREDNLHASMRWSGRISAAQAIYATILVNRPKFHQSRNASTPTEPISTLLFINFRLSSETGDYTDARRNCQALSRLRSLCNLSVLCGSVVSEVSPDRYLGQDAMQSWCCSLIDR